MRFRLRKTVRLGPVRLNFTQGGFTSWGLKLGPLSWNAKTRRTSVDTPGPGSVQFGGRKK